MLFYLTIQIPTSPSFAVTLPILRIPRMVLILQCIMPQNGQTSLFKIAALHLKKRLTGYFCSETF